MKWCLGFYPDAELILDPYMGSGTTLRAAKDLGRKANKIVLTPSNATMVPMVFDPDQVTIYGKVVTVMRRL